MYSANSSPAENRAPRLGPRKVRNRTVPITNATRNPTRTPGGNPRKDALKNRWSMSIMSIRTVARLLSLSKHRALAAYPGRPFDRLRDRPTSSRSGPSTSSGSVPSSFCPALRQAQGPSHPHSVRPLPSFRAVPELVEG